MLVCPDYKLLFIHNPKAGGTAIRQALAEYSPNHLEFWHQGYLPESDRVVDLAHLEVTEAEEFGVFARNFITLFVCRDPIERFLSGLDEHCRQHQIDIKNVNDFVHSLTIGNLHYDWKYVHMRPQYRFLRGIPVLSNKLVVVAHEELERSWGSLGETLRDRTKRQFNISGLLPKTLPPLPRVRVRPDSEKRFRKEDLSLESLQRLNRFYWNDYSLFGYLPAGYPRSDYSHYDNIEMIHRPGMDTFLDTSKLSSGEQLALGKKIKR